jgi:hypothetical protein
MILVSKYVGIPFYDSPMEFIHCVPQFRPENKVFNREMKMFPDFPAGGSLFCFLGVIFRHRSVSSCLTGAKNGRIAHVSQERGITPLSGEMGLVL